MYCENSFTESARRKRNAGKKRETPEDVFCDEVKQLLQGKK